MTFWTLCLYVAGVLLPLTALLSLITNPGWGGAAWLVVALIGGAACIGGARERQRRRRPAHER